MSTNSDVVSLGLRAATGLLDGAALLVAAGLLVRAEPLDASGLSAAVLPSDFGCR